eukprot:NODE_330_length_3162_cov_7.099835.p1 GENE.NODE_330_length_3162_cov_7.099835~~NODE_330_length_3162_cov_7.099835.p1  ORF type:complete len:549 (-),score=179.57 NODE_330_length_3162_cov_7.099835:348-1994(-)
MEVAEELREARQRVASSDAHEDRAIEFATGVEARAEAIIAETQVQEARCVRLVEAREELDARHWLLSEEMDAKHKCFTEEQEEFTASKRAFEAQRSACTAQFDAKNKAVNDALASVTEELVQAEEQGKRTVSEQNVACTRAMEVAEELREARQRVASSDAHEDRAIEFATGVEARAEAREEASHRRLTENRTLMNAKLTKRSLAAAECAVEAVAKCHEDDLTQVIKGVAMGHKVQEDRTKAKAVDEVRATVSEEGQQIKVAEEKQQFEATLPLRMMGLVGEGSAVSMNTLPNKEQHLIGDMQGAPELVMKTTMERLRWVVAQQADARKRHLRAHSSSDDERSVVNAVTRSLIALQAWSNVIKVGTGTTETEASKSLQRSTEELSAKVLGAAKLFQEMNPYLTYALRTASICLSIRAGALRRVSRKLLELRPMLEPVSRKHAAVSELDKLMWQAMLAWECLHNFMRAQRMFMKCWTNSSATAADLRLLFFAAGHQDRDDDSLFLGIADLLRQVENHQASEPSAQMSKKARRISHGAGSETTDNTRAPLP